MATISSGTAPARTLAKTMLSSAPVAFIAVGILSLLVDATFDQINMAMNCLNTGMLMLIAKDRL